MVKIAVEGSNVPTKRWKELDWSVVDSHSVSPTADAYRSYVQSSRGEFSVAKNVYVATHSGWFSCRSVCYLAASRPVVVQDREFTDFIPTGQGLFAFSYLDEAVAAITAIENDYESHHEAASKYFRSG